MRTLIVSLLFCVSTAVLAQDSPTERPLSAEHPYRDPHKARILATILPGAGYAYTGEYLRAYGTWVVTASGLMVGPIILADDCSLVSWTCNTQARIANILDGSLLVIVAATTWIRSVRDAPKSAERANERRRRRELDVRPTISVPQSRNGVTAGFSVAW
jgi:hypothetical protein